VGVSLIDYVTYRLSLEWADQCRRALQWAEHRCQLCYADETAALSVHHRTYERLGAERPADLTVLCWRCHAAFHVLLERAPEGWVRAIEYADALESEVA
jgi:5-methylcytosine-specific restriction endonuclease McrA